MTNLLASLALALLFYLLLRAADMVVDNVKKAWGSEGDRVFAAGIILGLITSLPELVIAINAFAGGVPLLSIGNLLGGGL